MSVLLNITMQKTCEVCPCNDDNWRCGATKEYFDYDDMCERRRADCPLIEVPPHGRLIDADFEEQHYTSMTTNPTPDVTEQDRRNSLIIVEALQMAKTVIEAEGTK